MLELQHDIAVALVDVVMESYDAGLKLVEHIRHRVGNSLIRIVIRTGQPGVAPERYVIDNYDIDDYKDKTELTAGGPYTTVRWLLKAIGICKSSIPIVSAWSGYCNPRPNFTGWDIRHCRVF